MATDATILAIFGEPPAGTNLSDEVTTPYNIVSIVFFVLASLSVALRFYVRIKNKTVAQDDYAVVAGLMSSAALLATTILAGQQGAGQHIWTLTIPRFITLFKLVYAEPFVYALAVTTTKISILLLYRRLFHAGRSRTNRLYAVAYWTAAGLTVLYPIIMFITMAVACRPVSYWWNQYLGATDGTCINLVMFYLVFGVVNMVIDMIILTVPIPRIVALQLNKRKKISILGVMLLGSFVCLASVIRIVYLSRLTDSVDISWWMGPGMAWSSIEPSVAIISACLPTFAPLLRMGSSNNRSSKREGRSDDYYGHSHSLSARYGVHRASASRANAIKDEDEMELTKGGRGLGRTFDSASNLSSSGGHATNGGGIVVDTVVRVSSEEGTL